MRILITGVSGFIGSHLGRRLADRHDILGFYRLASRVPPFRSVRVDLADEKSIGELIRDFSPQTIVHAAALSRVIECEDHPVEAMAVNVAATERLVRWAEKLHAKFIYLSSDQVFSGKKGALRESDHTEPVNQYGRTKLEAEMAVLNSTARVLVIRSNSVVGRNIGWGESFSDMILSRLRRNESVVAFTDQYRSPIHIRSMLDVLETSCVRDVSGLLHVGGLKRMSRLDTAYAVVRAYRLCPDLVQSGSYLSHDRASIMTADTSYDINKMLQALPEVKLRSIEEEFLWDAQSDPE